LQLRILSIEDTPSQSKLVERSLSNAGFLVSSCSSISEARELLAQFEFCVAVVDLSLFNEDGMTLVAEISNSRPKTKIIIHTANASFESARDGLELGVYAYVEKSRGVVFLVEQVRRASSAHLLDSLVEIKRESELQIRMLDAVQVGAIATDAEFKIIYLNSVGKKVFNFSDQNAIGMNALNLFTLTDHAQNTCIQEIRSLLVGLEQETKWEGDVQVASFDGSHGDHASSTSDAAFRLSISPIVETTDTIRGYIFVFADVTEQRRAAMELEKSRLALSHAQRIATIGQIANTLAHEINQPLGAISNYAGGMLLGLKNDSITMDSLVENLARIQEHALRAGEITSRLRTFVSRRRGYVQIFDMNELIRETLRLVEPVLREHRVTPELRLADGKIYVEGDRVQLSQVLVNLLKNAAEAIDSVPSENRVCRIISSSTKDRVQVCVEDHGPGLKEQEIEWLFQPVVSTKEGGMGLGLCISYSIVEEQGGTIAIEKSDGGGLVVCLQFPAVAN
jgi:C4-dicarboxylate-specific signal transduction histidine kinase